MKKQKHRPHKKTNAESGFSIMELAVAIFFIAVILTAVAANMTRAARALWESRTRFYAVNMAQNCIEDFNYAHRKRSWSSFYGPHITQASADRVMAELCSLPAPPAGSPNRMTYLCCGDHCTVEGIGSGPDCEPELFDNWEDEDPVLSQVYGGNITNVWQMRRSFFDQDTQTEFDFWIRMASGEVTFYRQTRIDDGISPTGVLGVVEETRDIVVVVIDASWEKFAARGDGRNHFSTTRQFLAPI